MPRLTLNLGEATSFEPVPDGVYTCKVVEISEPKTGAKSTYVRVTFEVAEGDFEGRKLWSNYPISGKGAGMFAEFWEKTTGEELEIGSDEGIDVDTDDALGAMIGVRTQQEEYPAGSSKMSSKVVGLVKVS